MKIDKITKEISKKKNTDMKILLNKIMTDNIRITAGFLSSVSKKMGAVDALGGWSHVSIPRGSAL